MNKLRHGLPPLPARWAKLPIDERGYPVPYFVAIVNGKPDHRVVDPSKKVRAIKNNLCWLCGRHLESVVTFVIGPMCGVNHITSEPPCHEECARYAVATCPFLTRPRAQRRDANLPDAKRPPPGVMIERNPGVSLLWTTGQWRLEMQEVKAADRGNSLRQNRLRGNKPVLDLSRCLFKLAPAIRVEWWAEGRAATRAEVEESVDSGLPILREAASGDAADLALIDLLHAELIKRYPAE